MDAELLTPQDVVKRYRGAISAKTLANWRCSGTGPAYVKIGGRVLYPANDLQKWEESRRYTATNSY